MSRDAHPGAHPDALSEANDGNEARLVPTPSQTVGPYFHLGLAGSGALAGPRARGERIRLTFRVLDAEGAAVDDALLELWQADADGRYPGDAARDAQHDAQPGAERDAERDPERDADFRGFARQATDAAGACAFETVRPGRVADAGVGLQAPHVAVSVFARGLLRRLVTRVYFAGDPANDEDPILARVPAARRETLLARPDPERPGTWHLDLRLAGEGETVFFDV
jgi:protocatechuate 3,4-dioxygenase alpha subunit